jgi:hypothetical protein
MRSSTAEMQTSACRQKDGMLAFSLYVFHRAGERIGDIRKVGEKRYRLTPAGRSAGEALLRSHSSGVSAKEVSMVRAALDCDTTAAFDRLLSSEGAQKILSGRPEATSLRDACGFWDITRWSNANTLICRLANMNELLNRAFKVLAAKSDKEGLKLANANLTKQQIRMLRDSHKEMQGRFKRELDIIRSRTDERADKRSRPL